MEVNKQEQEALEDLVSSEGWAVFKRLVEEIYNPVVMQRDAVDVVGKSKDLATMGAGVASLIVSHETAALVLRIPDMAMMQVDVKEVHRAKANR